MAANERKELGFYAIQSHTTQGIFVAIETPRHARGLRKGL